MKKSKGYILTVIISLFVGVIGTLITLKYCGVLDKVVEVNKTVKDVKIVEANSLKESLDKIYDAVVYIESTRSGYLTSSGSGSGFVYKVDNKYAYILTNAHVISNSAKVEVTNIEGATEEAKVLGLDDYSDIAVLRVSKDLALKVATLGNSDESSLGDTVFTVGSPMGKDYMGSVTKGILSGKNRTITTSNKYVMEVLQVDAALNPGNSGGPLVNINGEVIGINSLKLSQSEIEGMGFAIPIELVKTISEKLEKGESIERPVLGVNMLDLDNTYQLYRNGIILNEDIDEGAVVVEVVNNTPAFKAGLQKGDVILSINGVHVKDVAFLRAELYKYNIGDTITLKYMRGKQIKDVKIKLDVKMENS